jgi:GNAT superfamily N-acetyltransferase
LEKREENLFQERADFLKEHYPLKESHYDLEDLLCNSLDGKEVIERRDDNGDIEAFMTYEIEEDDEKNSYCSLGVILTREESRGEGVMNELFEEIKEIAREGDGVEWN